jgi:hypothetical protein
MEPLTGIPRWAEASVYRVGSARSTFGPKSLTSSIRRSSINLGVQLALATFGKITNTVNKGRQVQMTLKLNF